MVFQPLYYIILFRRFNDDIPFKIKHLGRLAGSTKVGNAFLFKKWNGNEENEVRAFVDVFKAHKEMRNLLGH